MNIQAVRTYISLEQEGKVAVMTTEQETPYYCEDIKGIGEELCTSILPDTLNICWNLDQTVAPILRLLTPQNLKILHMTNKCHQAPFNIFYVPSKLFSINPVFDKRATFNLYDLSQYYDGDPEPDSMDELVSKGQDLLLAFKEMNLYPQKLTSPVAVYQQEVMNHVTLPGIKDIPVDAAVLGYECAAKLWVEAYQIGCWDNAIDYDLTSSFPSVIRNLVDIRNCDWTRSKKFLQGAIYGYCKVKLTIYDKVQIHPIIHTDEEGRQSTPTGTWETTLTMAEMEFIHRWKIGEYEILDGWWALPRKLTYPVRPVVDRLLAHKSSDNPLVRMLAKRMSVGVYGKFGEEHKDGFGKQFNPVYFAEISSQIRLKVAEFIYFNHLTKPEDLIHVSVDGILVSPKSTATPGMVEAVSKDWRLNYKGQALVISSGMVFFRDKKPKGLYIDDVLGMINDKPNASYYANEIQRRTTLAEAIRDETLDEVGRIRTTYSSVDLYMLEPEREFIKMPQTGKQLVDNKYQSRARQVNNE